MTDTLPSDEASEAEPELSSSPIARLHRWLAVPKMDLGEEHFELYSVTNWVMAVGLLAHGSFIPTFWYLGVPRLAIVNIGSVLCFVLALWLSRHAKLLASLIVGAAEVAAHAWVATWFFGLESLFHIHSLLGLELLVLFSWVGVRWRVIFGSGVALSYLALMVAAYGAPPLHPLSYELGVGFAVFNAFIFTSATTGMLAYFTWTVQVNRDARDRAREQVLARTRDLEEKNARLKESELALAGARDQAETGSRAKSMFLANMSHELRTPLNAIIGYSEMIVEDADDRGDTDLSEEAGRICGAGRHLAELIDHILDLSKIEAGRMEVESVEFSISDLVRDVMSTAFALAARNDNSLTHAPAEGEAEFSRLGALRSDPTKIRQILFNLLSNACKFTKGGVVSLEVERRDQESGDEPAGVSFSVTDTGIGMDQATLERIFGEFSQGDGSTTREYGGTGLGLTISRRFAQLLGGGITVESTRGEGSCFTLWLPIEAPSGAGESGVGHAIADGN